MPAPRKLTVVSIVVVAHLLFLATSRSLYMASEHGWGITGYIASWDYRYLWWFPGYASLARLEGALLARRDIEAGHPQLLGAGIFGGDLLGLENCGVIEGPSREWLRPLASGEISIEQAVAMLPGDAVVSCTDPDGREHEFSVPVREIGCIIEEATVQLSTGYNRETVAWLLDVEE